MISRRRFNHLVVALAGGTLISPVGLASATNGVSYVKKVIPKSGESIAAIGMGTWITFDKQKDKVNVAEYVKILQHFFTAGGQMIDSSPMYGYAQQFLGVLLAQIKNKESTFSATKVWIPGKSAGIQQMQKSAELWGVTHFDLMHIHNMLDWKTHIKTLNQWKAEGKLRYTGITTSHGRRHIELIDMLKSNSIDFVQISYNIMDRKAEDYLLPLAQDLGIAVVINRPFKTGALFNHVKSQSLPDWADEIGCKTWSQFFLKYIIAHPAVTCAIPATSQLSHMQENMVALSNTALPDKYMRKEMLNYFNSITQ